MGYGNPASARPETESQVVVAYLTAFPAAPGGSFSCHPEAAPHFFWLWWKKYKATQCKQQQPMGRSYSSPPPFSPSPAAQRHPLPPPGENSTLAKPALGKGKKKKKSSNLCFWIEVPGGSTTVSRVGADPRFPPPPPPPSTFNFLVSALK